MILQESDHQPLRIAMVTEFFYPRCGGVEMHVLSISQALLKQGCHVCHCCETISNLGYRYYSR